MSALVVGTDRRTLLSVASPHGGPGRTTAVPAGVRHAVPRGTRIALCGEAPPVLWDRDEWPGRAHDSDLCPACRAVQRATRSGGAAS